MRNFSIKQKLMLITLASSTVALSLVAFAFLTYEYITFRQVMTQDLSTLAQIIGNRSTAALTFDDKNSADENLRALSAQKGIVAACLYKDESLFAEYQAAGQSNLRAVPVQPQPDCWSFTDDHLELFHRIELNGDSIGTIYLRSDLRELHARLWRYALIMLLFMLASLAATYSLAARLQRIISLPIFHLAQTAKTVSLEKNYSVRALKETNDELGQLIDGFNEMLGQIQERDGALQRAKDDLEKRVEERTRDLQQQFTRISLLNQITYAVAARQDFESIVLVVLQQLEDHLPIDYGAAYLLDAENETLKVMARGPKSRPLAEQLQIPANLPVALTPFAGCLQGEMVYVPDHGQLDLPMSQHRANSGLLSSLATPLIVEEKVVGLLALMRRQKDGFSMAERDFIHGLSAHVAVAIHQAQLYQDLQKAYDELRQTQQTVMQQERLKALGQMASGIAHDINNALSPIVGFADLLIQMEAGLGQNAKKHLHYIKTAGLDIAHIVARLREFYRRRDEGETHSALCLNELAKQVVDMTRPRWRDIPQSRGVMIEMRTDLDLDLPELPGIASEVREALTNLIINAVDAIPNGGQITVRTCVGAREFSALRKSAPSHVVLEVHDTGVGMNEETRKRCMEPFFSTKGQRGTGLGLAMVYGVMERHEGKIEIESVVSKGTTMKLIFPVRNPAGANPPARESDETLAPLRILCIDDEPLLRELMHEILERDGHEVQVADSGQGGVDAFRAAGSRSQPFDVVITDLGMPYFDGRQVAKSIKHDSPSTPVVMLTGWGAFMKEDGDKPAQVDGILCKPPRLAEIRDMLRRVTQASKG